MNKNWEMKTLGDLCEVVTKGTTPTSVGFSFVSKGINFIKVESIDENRNFIREKFAAISKECHDNLKRSQLKKGDILFSIAGALGRIALVSDDILPANTNQALAIIRLKSLENVNTNFILRTLESGMIFEQINKFKGGVAQQNLSLEQVKSFQFPLPLLSVQEQIVNILDETFIAVGQAKENVEKNLYNVKELFESYLQSVFSSKDNSWEEKSLGEVYDVRDGTHDSPKYHSKGFALITSKNLKNDFLNFDDVSFISEHDYININKRSKVDKGDVLFAMIGTIGNPVVIQDEPDFAIKNVALFKVPKEQDSYFLKYFLDSKMVIDKMAHDAKGTTQKFVGLGYLRDFKIWIPKLSEQREIVNKLNAFSAECKKLEVIYQKKLSDLEALRQSILHKAFSGELTEAHV